MQPFRILSLDGGGSWALIEVKALMALYGPDMGGHEVLSHFDLVAANSGGSIVLGCLIEDLTLQQILDFFNDEEQRKAVFSKTDFADRALKQVIGVGPKYSSENKLPALQRVLTKRGDLSLRDAVGDIRGPGAQESLHVLIISFDYDRNRAVFFRSKVVDGPSWGRGEERDVTLAEAIHASTNAPVNYFDGPATFPERAGRYWDGALTGCNNPVLAGVTEAIGLKQPPRNIVALSLGTGGNALPLAEPDDPPSPFTQPISKSGLLGDIQKLSSAILDDPADSATFLAHVMTGCAEGLDPAVSPSRVVRLNPLVSPMRADERDPWGPPGTMTPAQFAYLAALDMDAVEQPPVDAITDFADLWLQDEVRNQPIRMDTDTLTCELGQEKFSAGAAVWKKLSVADTMPPTSAGGELPPQ